MGCLKEFKRAQRTQIFCGEVKFNTIATSRNVLRLWRLLEAINDQRMQKWYNFHPKVTYNSSALSSNIILKLILRLLEVIWDCLRSFEVILLCKSLVEGVSDIKLSLCIRQLDLLCLYFHEHVFKAKVEATRGCWMLLVSILLHRSNLTVWESTNLWVS